VFSRVNSSHQMCTANDSQNFLQRESHSPIELGDYFTGFWEGTWQATFWIRLIRVQTTRREGNLRSAAFLFIAKIKSNISN
jgi:hypothetical protein